MGAPEAIFKNEVGIDEMFDLRNTKSSAGTAPLARRSADVICYPFSIGLIMYLPVRKQLLQRLEVGVGNPFPAVFSL